MNADADNRIPLTSSEMGMIWSTYINDTMAACVLKYFLHKAEDSEIKSLNKRALSISTDHIEQLQSLFHNEQFPVPQGFTDEDVNVQAKRLFSDNFTLYYVKHMAKVGLTVYSMAYSSSSRKDIRAFFRDCLNQTEELDQLVTEILQSKGLYIRPPYISPPDKVDFVQSNKFLSGGFFGFLDKRPLTTIEISHLFANIETNAVGKALLMGFNQVTPSADIRHYLSRGVDISSKHIELFAKLLKEDHLPVPMTWDADVTDSTEPPFSEKLILFHISILVATGTANYGVAASASPRRDIAADYVRLAAEIASYTEDGAKLLIKKGWFEEPPQALDREELAKA